MFKKVNFNGKWYERNEFTDEIKAVINMPNNKRFENGREPYVARISGSEVILEPWQNGE